MNQIKVELQETMGSDRSIAEAAWTSSLDFQKKETRSDADVERVVKMLAEHKHSTPFESVIFRFWIKMPISCDRQHMTHRIASHNGMSGRYRTMPAEWQSVPEDILEIYNKLPGLGKHYLDQYDELCSEANEVYRQAVLEFKKIETEGFITNNEMKRLREFFRGVLPQNNMTERVTTMNLRSFANYQKLRNSEHAQPEIRQVAKLMLEAVKASGVSPIALAALEANGWII
jgi:thymidylate synthase (FAD)